MKNALFVAFAGLCIFTSILGTSVNSGKIYGNRKMDQLFIIRDTVPQPDSPVNPKHDTTKKPYIIDMERK